MVEESIATFETFCLHQDMAALAAEQGIANQYREVVRTYVGFADFTPSSSKFSQSPPIAFRWRHAGLRAIKAVVSTDGLAADGGESLRITLPMILRNLYTGENDVLGPLQARLQGPESKEVDPPRRRASVATVPTVDAADGDAAVASQSAADVDRKSEMDARLLALRCLERIVVSGSNRGQIRIATTVVLRFILNKDPIRPKGDVQSAGRETSENWATSLMELVARWCPVQVRFVILVTAMELLLEIHPTEEVLEKPFTIVYLIDWLLKSQVNMIGLSVMDVLLGLLHYISLSLAPPEAKGTEENDAAEPKQEHARTVESSMSPQRRELLSLLQTCIGNLATHIYYGDQVADLVRATLSRFKSPAALENLTAQPPRGQPDSPTAPSSDANSNGFSQASAKTAGLKAIKNILTVTNFRRPMTAPSIDSRDHIGIHVWDGTQWLLRAPERDVRHAYADALLSYLKLETSKKDLRRKDERERRPTISKQDSLENAENVGKRTVSPVVSQGEKATLASQSNFLRLLHLTIYDIALECATEESEVLLLHLLLANLVQSLGVTAVRFGLPMILKLQDDMNTVGGHHQLVAKVNIGSLSYGYFWALSEKFGLEASKVGSEIRREIERRKKHRVWLQKVCVPPLPLDNIVSGNEACTNGDSTGDPSQLRPFQSSVVDLVDRIEEAYNLSTKSPAQSPPSSPTRSLSIPVFSRQITAVNLQKSLPADVKEQMLSPWSRESCLAAVEQENARAMSLSGSRVGAMPIHSQTQVNGDKSSSIAYSRTSAHQGDAAGMGTGATEPTWFWRGSVPDLSLTQAGSSSRGSPVRVKELRRALSVNNGSQARRLSPLRGRLDASSSSIISWSGESVATVSDAGEDVTSVRRLSSRGGQVSPNDDGMGTPRALSAGLAENGSQPEQTHPARKGDVDEIPPVPPIPSALSIPGCFPNDSQRSLPPGDRPSTAPDGTRKGLSNEKIGIMAPTRDKNTLSRRRKSRSATGLAIEAGIIDPSVITGSSGSYGDGHTSMAAEKDSDRRDIQRFVNKIVSPDDGGRNNGEATPASRAGRRSVRGGGIGRPPY